MLICKNFMMEVKTINSFKELRDTATDLDTSYVLLHKKGSEVSECALKNIENAIKNRPDFSFFTIDVNNVRDVHSQYEITSVPTLLEFEKGQLKNLIKGCNSSDFYSNYFDNKAFIPNTNPNKKQKSVTVYTTPTCSWCNTLKTHLRKNGISFREVDVSRDEKAAQDMVRKSGQQGVPQTDIEGRMIIGFDKNKINELLEIKG